MTKVHSGSGPGKDVAAIDSTDLVEFWLWSKIVTLTVLVPRTVSNWGMWWWMSIHGFISLFSSARFLLANSNAGHGWWPLPRARVLCTGFRTLRRLGLASLNVVIGERINPFYPSPEPEGSLAHVELILSTEIGAVFKFAGHIEWPCKCKGALGRWQTGQLSVAKLSCVPVPPLWHSDCHTGLPAHPGWLRGASGSLLAGPYVCAPCSACCCSLV